MFDDELDRLRQDPRLVELLAHYAGLEPLNVHPRGAEPRWMGSTRAELSRLHGELIAFDWIEQNPSRASPTLGTVQVGIYRITPQGVRDLCQVKGIEVTDRVEEPEKEKPRIARKKKQKALEAEKVETASTDASEAA